ncbi:uncharacterized protein DUF3883 [Paenibacillus taihuensis]|uniref:Uncharacterized protein DUF3883 n=1 Tax=Paenibacillus taihuensis TaxID=1156355 RepID=A0A3D9SG63_9BACL|nr:DUF3883 domain-containing protein [Paenibacillus taihuensis]REE90608.1 uncharacterized protein DUF3883 [Paenibacillus taihuensis]
MVFSSYSYVKMSESQKYIETLCNEYIEKHIKEQERDELIHENNIEKRDIKGYHGREILELLQNADDAYQKSIDEGNKPDCELEVLIEFKNNILKVSNTGTFFDKDGIKAIVQGNNSSKSGKYIGNKGTGFRSVLNWADEIRIHSGEFNIRFAKEIADELFQKNKSEKQIAKQLNKQLNLYIPILAVPQNIEPCQKDRMTSIEIFVNPVKTLDDFGVLQQINNIDLRILLFLPNISRITIETEEKNFIYEREVNNGELRCLTLKKYVNDENQILETFYVFDKVIENAIEEDDIKKDIRLAIAVPQNFKSFQAGNIYSFFPLLNVESPFNCVMHASYILGDHRDSISRTDANKMIIIEQLKFLVEVGEKFTSNQYADTALRLLTPVNIKQTNWKFPLSFSQFGDLEDYYFQLLEHAKVLQTVNDEYISVKDNPKIFDTGYPQFFLGEKFKTFLKPLPSESAMFIQSMLRRLFKSLTADEFELLPIINSLTNEWTISQRVEVFNWWNRNYSKSLPELLKTQNGNWLKFDMDCYFLVGEFSNKGLPSWVNVPSLDSEYQQLLFKGAEQLPEVRKIRETDKETHISRIISQRKIYPLVKFTYRDRSNIISTVNSSVDSYSKAIDFVKWLWSNYRKEEDSWTPPKGSEQSPIKYNFPNAKDNKVQNSQQLYFGRAYEREWVRNLFDDTYEEFPSPDLFSISNEEALDFVSFISKFGVKKFPAIATVQIVTPLDSYVTEYKKLIQQNADLGSSTTIYVRCKLPFISHLQDKLKNITTTDIIKWIYEDYTLRSYLTSPYYSENAEITYQGNLQQYERRYQGPIKNYLLRVFNEVKWIEIGGKRYAPKQILKDINSRNNGKFSDLIPVIDVQYIQDIAYRLGIDYYEVLGIIELFDFCDKVTDLSSNDFYSLMLKLPEYNFEKSVELSKLIYRIIEQSHFTKKYEDSENKKRFFEAGKVLVQFQGVLQHYPAKKAYLPSSRIISKNNVPIVEKGQRTNNDNFIRTFGCQLYNKDYAIIKESVSESKSNPDFQLYFNEFLKYAASYSERNENFERDIKRLSVVLVDKISIIENDQVAEITDEYICIRETATSWYITVFGNEFEINLVSEAIENICANIANTVGFESGKLGELFRAKEKTDREFLIKKEFGSLDVIADRSYNNEKRNNFVETVMKINKNYPVKEINIDFEDFHSDQNAEKIINLLMEIGVDVYQFRDEGFVYSINLIPYYKAKLVRFINKEKRKFKNVLYTKAVKNEGLQAIFLSTVMKFENFEIENYENSIYFDVELIVKKAFASWYYNELPDNEIIDSDAQYSKNYELLNPDRLFEDDIANNYDVRKMIYFNKTEEFEAWLVAKKNAQSANETVTDDAYSKYKDVIPQKVEPLFRNLEIIKERNKPRGNGSYNPSSAERRNRTQKVFGNKGELLVYNLLCEQFGEDNVYPRSEAFVEIGILKPGQAKSGQFDLSYKDERGIEYFVEVKAGDGNSFIISPGELEFAKQNSNHYKLFLVHEIDSENPKCTELPMKFWEDKKFRKTEIVERIEFEF